LASVVVDSGILIASVLKERFFQKADALLEYWRQNNLQLAAPVLFQYEVVAVARKVVFQKRATLEEAIEARDFMLSYEVETYLDEALLKRAYELATQFDRPTAYDAQYLAIAERLNCEFWTADEKLFNSVHDKLDWVKWVGNFEPAG
jgi:predicted nucleic acid-binding protein